jgi:hypothetical protein
MFENWKLERQLKRRQLESDISQFELLNKTFIDAQKFAQPDPDENQWMKTSEFGHITEIGSESYDHYEMLRQAFRFWITDLHARAIVRNLTKFVLGKGPTVRAISKNEIVRANWDNFVKLNKWSKRVKEIVSRTFRDGEALLRFFVNTNNGDVKLRFIRADNVRNPTDSNKILSGENTSFGIGCDPEDIEDVKSYYVCDKGGNFKERIDASEIMHLKILSDSDMKRGMSILLVAMPMIKKYSGWMDDRIVLNKIRSAIALVREVPGTAATVDSIRGKNQSERFSADQFKQKGFNRGTIITASKGIKYSMLTPNIQAADAKDDGRNMLLAVAAGVGFPEMMLTADYSNSNYASSMTAQNPFVREIEDWQDFFEEPYKEVFARVIQAGKRYGAIPEDESEECTIEWPPLILADIQKNNAAREIQHRNKIISKKTWQMKEDLDPETEEQNMTEEQEKDIYKQPFNLPAAPTNQFGQYNEE